LLIENAQYTSYTKAFLLDTSYAKHRLEELQYNKMYVIL